VPGRLRGLVRPAGRVYLARMPIAARSNRARSPRAPRSRTPQRCGRSRLSGPAVGLCLALLCGAGGCGRDEASTATREADRHAGPGPQAGARVDTGAAAAPADVPDRHLATAPAAEPAVESSPAAAAVAGGPRVALVIDDLGQRVTGPDAALLALPVPLTLAVLPGRPHSRAVAALAAGRPGSDGQSQRDLFLHLPMEPQGYPGIDPGPGALLVGQAPAEVAARLEQGLASVPGAIGVNNHMGSAATADTLLMEALMSELASRGLRFLDSLTTPHSVAWQAARRAGVPCARNRLFLDVDHTDEDAVSARLAELVAVARRSGQAIGIAHPHPATAAVLTREIPLYVEDGVRFVTVSELMTAVSPATNTSNATGTAPAPGADHGR
jgi:uncharacterized protein